MGARTPTIFTDSFRYFSQFLRANLGLLLSKIRLRLFRPHECYKGLWDFLLDRSLYTHRTAQHKMLGNVTTPRAEFDWTEQITITNWKISVI
jgi:hypothetical protein